MKIFIDTEFTGLRKDTTLISLGIVYEDGSELYAEFTDYNESQLEDFHREHIMDKLSLGDMDVNSIRFDDKMCKKYIRGDKEFVGREIDFWHQYIMKDYDNEKIHVWSDCLAYDWVLFCDMFGGALSLPKNILYIPFDICTLFLMKNIDPDISREGFVDEEAENKHNALHDARVIKKCYEKLTTL
jgi:hypothetical protein